MLSIRRALLLVAACAALTTSTSTFAQDDAGANPANPAQAAPPVQSPYEDLTPAQARALLRVALGDGKKAKKKEEHAFYCGREFTLPGNFTLSRDISGLAPGWILKGGQKLADDAGLPLSAGKDVLLDDRTITADDDVKLVKGTVLVAGTVVPANTKIWLTSKVPVPFESPRGVTHSADTYEYTPRDTFEEINFLGGKVAETESLKAEVARLREIVEGKDGKSGLVGSVLTVPRLNAYMTHVIQNRGSDDDPAWVTEIRQMDKAVMDALGAKIGDQQKADAKAQAEADAEAVRARARADKAEATTSQLEAKAEELQARAETAEAEVAAQKQRADDAEAETSKLKSKLAEAEKPTAAPATQHVYYYQRSNCNGKVCVNRG